MSEPNQSLSMEDIMKLAASPAGQRLLQLLQQHDSREMQQAVQKAAKGDFTSAKQAISTLMEDPQVKEILEQFRR